MFITLLDTHKRQEITLEVTIEYTIPASHLLLVLANRHTQEQDISGQESPAFGQYRFKPLHHQAGVKFRYDGKPYSLTLGFYWESQTDGFIPVVLDQAGNQQPGRFATAPSRLLPQDNANTLVQFDEIHLLDRREHQALQELGLETLSWREFVSRSLDANRLKPLNRCYYDITNEKKDTFALEDLVDEERYYDFLDEHNWPPQVS